MSDFVDFNLAKKLKEKGFKEDCLAHFTFEDDITYNINSDIIGRRLLYCCNGDTSIWANGLIDAPTISQVLKWLRNEYNILVSPSVYGDEDGRKWNYAIVDIETFELLNPVLTSNLASFEEAAIVGINYVLDNLI